MLLVVNSTEYVTPCYLTVPLFDVLRRYETVFPAAGRCDWYRNRLFSSFWVRSPVDLLLGLLADNMFSAAIYSYRYWRDHLERFC